MKITMLDTETSGLPLWREPSDDPRQPHMLQLAALRLEWDEDLFENPTRVIEFNRFVKPEGWQVDERPIGDDGKPTAFSIHGISNAKLNDLGRPLAEIMDEFDAEFLAPADELYAYGAAFDRRILRIASRRRWGQEHPRKGAIAPPWFCVLATLTPLVKMTATGKMYDAGFGDKFKPPKLAEAHKWAFEEDFDGAHDAMNDLRATKRLWSHIRDKHDGAFVQISAKE